MVTDDKNFREQFADVKPLKKTDRVQLKKSAEVSNKTRDVLRRNAVEPQVREYATPFATVSDDYVEKVSPADVLSFKRPGIQDAVFKKLRLGKYPIEGKLDLHRKKVVQARREVLQFVADGMRYDMRCLLIVHGKGERSPDEQATLKSYVAKWLKENPEVMAYHSASVQHGGVGAVYVMLRKSERAKETTREQLGRKK